MIRYLLFGLSFLLVIAHLSGQDIVTTTQKSILLTHRDSGKMKMIRSDKNIKIQTSDGQTYHGMLSATSQSQLMINHNALNHEISSVSLPSAPAQIAGGALIVTGVLLIITSKELENQDSLCGILPAASCNKISNEAIASGAVVAALGVGLLLTKKKYDLKSKWTLQIQ